MQKRGIKIDLKENEKQIKKWTKRKIESSKKIEKSVPGLNPNSPKQLIEYFFKKEGLVPTNYTKKERNPKTDLNALQKINHPVAKLIIQARTSERALNSFFYKFKDLQVNNIIHPNFIQIKARTGRYSCIMPNMHSTPDAHTNIDDPIQARMVFGPRKGFVWVLADYSQLEARILADFAKEKFMLKAFESGRDIFSEIAKKVWGKCSKEIRHRAKTLTYLKVYGGGVEAAANLIKCDFGDAYEYLNDYDKEFPRLQIYMDNEIKKLRKKFEPIYDAFGRRLYIDPNSLYKVVNYRVQGSAASLLKDRMLATWKWLKKLRRKEWKVWQVMTIHDEQVIEIEKKKLCRWFLKRLKRIMEDHGGRFNVKLPVNINVVTKKWNKKI